MSVAVVTDSTAMLTPDQARQYGVRVVPLQVVVGASAYDEGGPGGITPERLAEALREWAPVSTSRPNPEEMLAVYEELAASGVDAIVSVHLSAQLSGTFESAHLAARKASVPVVPVDSGQVGVGTRFAVLAAAEAAHRDLGAEEVAAAARTVAASVRSFFYVDTLEYLRRGGRIGATAALVGSALAVKPILTVERGRVVPFEKVRTSAKALARLEDLAVEATDGRPADIAVAHLASAERAGQLAERLGERLADALEGRSIDVGEIGAVLGAHVGPGMVAVCVARHL
jgi:DegV family protein with EDD domain